MRDKLFIVLASVLAGAPVGLLPVCNDLDDGTAPDDGETGDVKARKRGMSAWWYDIHLSTKCCQVLAQQQR